MDPSSTRGITRRRALAVAGTSIAIAGCLGDGGGDDGTEDDGTNDGNGTTDGAGGTGGDANGTDDGDGGDGTGDDPLAMVPESVALEPVVEGVERPIGMAVAPGTGLQYVIQQEGLVLGIDGEGRLDEPVLDLTESVVTEGNEQGLLGLAFHPEFESNRLAYVRYSAPSREGTPEDWSHTFVLASFEVSEDGTSFLPDTERPILEIPEPQSNHNAGDLAFGPDGYLYVPVGDGGGADDQGTGHVEDWYDEVNGGNGQDVTENLLGSVLRIDVDGGDPYAIPEDNPLVGEDGLDEHYAWGLRNPWRISFDAGGSGDGANLYVADVGQSAYEEVNLVEAGGNYGWNVKEATHCFVAEECPSETPSDVRGGERLIDPVIEYPHEGDGVAGISIIGGHVYRGSAISGLQGTYVFGDLNAQGRLFVAVTDGSGELWPTTTVAAEGAGLQALFAFGRDEEGELYALGTGEEGGGVWRIAPAG